MDGGAGYGALIALLALVFIPVTGMGLSAVLILSGAIWSPFAAVKAWRLARRAGLSPVRYALLGALYSVLLVVPSVYLLRRLRGQSLPRNLVVASYWVLYGVIWGFGAILPYGAVLWFLVEYEVYRDPGSDVSLDGMIGFAALWTATVIALTVSAWMVIRKSKSSHLSAPALEPRADLLPLYVYIVPIVLAPLGAPLLMFVFWAAVVDA